MENSAIGFSEGSEPIKLTEEKNGVKKHPDFNEWISQEEGLDCMVWPVSEPKYLRNRLFWAFDAGRNCVWDQYIQQKTELAEVKRFLQELYHSGNKVVPEIWRVRMQRFVK